MYLVIVESPGKIKTIQKILGNSYIIASTVGHIIDLPKKTLGLDIESGYKPIYTILPGKTKIINNLKHLVKKVNTVYLATDNDREGEFIAYSLLKQLKLKTYHRIIFNSITKDALLTAINNPIKINYNLVKAQQKRRIIDRLIGYKITPLLYKSKEIKQEYKKLSLSVGRVQTVILRYLYDRENEKKEFMENINISKFIDYNIIAEVDIHGINLKLNLYTLIDNELKLYVYETKSNELNDTSILEFPPNLKNFMIKLYDSEFKYKSPNTEKAISYISINPPSPLITTTLQQEANIKLRFTPKHTMSIAQKLYEKGFITYMRTDSCELSKETIIPIRNYIQNNFGINYYFYRSYKGNNKATAQEAHEAIRPVDFSKNTDSLSNQELDLYNIIYKRTIASQMIPQKKKVTDIELYTIIDDKSYILKGNYIKVIEPGYIIVYKTPKNILEDFNIDEKTKSKIILLESYIKKPNPPVLYSQISIIKQLEKDGIGRPSTYAYMLEKICSANYAIITNENGIKVNINNGFIKNKKFNVKKTSEYIGKETNKLKLTPLGINIILFMLKKFPQYVDYEYTRNMELYLNQI